jgi:ElaB/YqjD/DUF883 family membrane-anchored ribosome-binding protein
MDEPPHVTKEKLIADMKVVVDDAEDLLRATAHQAGEKVGDLRKRLEDNLSSARERISHTEWALVERAKAAAQATDAFVHDNPWKSIGIAAGLAFVLGILMGRR